MKLHSTYNFDIPFNEGTGNPANRGTATLTAYNGTPTWTTGVNGKCLRFDASAGTKQYIETNFVRGTNNFSMYCNILPVYDSSGRTSTLLATYGPWQPGFTDFRNSGLVSIYHIDSTNFGVQILFRENTGTTYGYAAINYLPYKPTFIGGSFDSTNKTFGMYANGQWATNSYPAHTYGNDQLTFRIGGQRDGQSDRFYNGTVSNLKLVTSVMTKQQFDALYFQSQSIIG